MSAVGAAFPRNAGEAGGNLAGKKRAGPFRQTIASGWPAVIPDMSGVERPAPWPSVRMGNKLGAPHVKGPDSRYGCLAL